MLFLGVVSCAVLLLGTASASGAGLFEDKLQASIGLFVDKPTTGTICSGGMRIHVSARSRIAFLASMVQVMPVQTARSELAAIEALHTQFVDAVKLEVQQVRIAALQQLDRSVAEYVKERIERFKDHRVVAGLARRLLPTQSRVTFNGRHSDAIPPAVYANASFGALVVPSFELLYLALQDAAHCFAPTCIMKVAQESVVGVLGEFLCSVLQPLSILQACVESELGPREPHRNDGTARIILKGLLGADELERLHAAAHKHSCSLLSAAFWCGTEEQVLAVLGRLKPLSMARVRKAGPPTALVHLLNAIYFGGIPLFEGVSYWSRFRATMILLKSLPCRTVGERLHGVLLPWVRDARHSLSHRYWAFMLDWVFLGTTGDGLEARRLLEPAKRFLQTGETEGAGVEEMLFRMACRRYFEQHPVDHLPAPPSSIHAHRQWRAYLEAVCRGVHAKL